MCRVPLPVKIEFAEMLSGRRSIHRAFHRLVVFNWSAGACLAPREGLRRRAMSRRSRTAIRWEKSVAVGPRFCRTAERIRERGAAKK